MDGKDLDLCIWKTKQSCAVTITTCHIILLTELKVVTNEQNENTNRTPHAHSISNKYLRSDCGISGINLLNTLFVIEGLDTKHE